MTPLVVYRSAVEKLTVIPDGLLVLMARLSLAAFFLRSARTKVEGFTITDSTYFLFAEEYDLPLLDPHMAAVLATTAEHVLPVLLILGLATRLSAAGLLAMTVVIQVFVYPGSWPDHLLWATGLLLILARGPGWLALDTWFAKRVGRAD